MPRYSSAVCPFYITDKPFVIHCEGKRKIRFKSDQECDEQLYKYCCSYDYVKCPIAIETLKGYEERYKKGGD